MAADDPTWRQWLVRAKDVARRRLVSGIRVAPPKDGYLVVPVLGQSNAHGAGARLDPDGLDASHPRVHQWAVSGRLRRTPVMGADPLLHETPSKGVGFAVAFAKQLADQSGRTVLLVPAARGDTSFTPKNGHTWDPADRVTRVNHYRRALTEIDTALSAHPGSRVEVVLWHQGESDVPLTPAADYAIKLDSLIDGLRARYGSDLPVLIGQMVPEEIEGGHSNYLAINAVHAGTPSRRRHTAFVAGPRHSYNSQTERIHYNAAGQRELGTRMWHALVHLRSQPSR